MTLVRSLPVIPVALGLMIGAAGAQTYPDKLIRIIVPQGPGGPTDLLARVAAQRLQAALHQNVIIENRGGAGGVIAAKAAGGAEPDGYTLFMGNTSVLVLIPILSRSAGYDPAKLFVPVARIAESYQVLVVHPSLPVKNVQELIAYGKANPGKLSFASSGPGGAPHMSGELFKSMTGIDMLNVPYKGSTAAHSDLLSGRTSVMFDTVTAINPHVKSGALRALAVTTAKRSAAAPDVPTMVEAGLKGYETSTWGGVLAPVGTPKDVVAKLNAEMNKALAAPDVRQRMLDAGIEPAGGTPQQFADFIQSEMMKWGKVAKTAGIQPE
jgi:tripartite-type tricarboxylate transporter receptor subunit TctC